MKTMRQFDQHTTAVVTGSTSGIGRAIALALASQGADIVVHGGHQREEAVTTAEMVQDWGRAASIIMSDFSSSAARSEFVEHAWGWHGKIDLLINNAGADVLTGEASQGNFPEKLERLWQVDVLGTIELSRSIGERMRRRGGGSIINMGWDQAEWGMEGDSGEMFAATKGAIMAFTRSLAKSLAPTVRVNCVAPGWIKTDWGTSASTYWETRACHESLRRRWGTPEDVAAMVGFLASPAADFVTGQICHVNGGRAGFDASHDVG